MAEAKQGNARQAGNGYQSAVFFKEKIGSGYFAEYEGLFCLVFSGDHTDLGSRRQPKGFFLAKGRKYDACSGGIKKSEQREKRIVSKKETCYNKNIQYKSNRS